MILSEASIFIELGDLPLHLALSQGTLYPDIILPLLNANPLGASVESGSGLIPLFLSVMRDNPVFEISKALCKAYPYGPRAMNSTESHPLHFALNRFYRVYSNNESHLYLFLTLVISDEKSQT